MTARDLYEQLKEIAEDDARSHRLDVPVVIYSTGKKPLYVHDIGINPWSTGAITSGHCLTIRASK